ncbi:MAG: amidase [Solirubrobacteraceae bacterium]|nr:amidase [Solirubrobacteraceae bacterium]
MDSRELAFAGAARQAELVRSGEVSPRELVDLCLDRIERLEPRLNAFRIVWAERARAEADQAAARARGGEDRPLLGVPVAVKDNIDVAGEVTAHGTAAFETRAREDSEVVRRLRAAGAIIVGKTLLPEFAVWPATQTATYGATVNPWHAGYGSGGSSGGSAVAVAAGLVGLAHASDGGGSIRNPAAHCGLFGLKPQRGRVSLAPDLEHWKGLSVYGCVTRTVADTALFLDAIAGPVASGGGEPSPPAPDRPFAEAAGAAPGRLRIAVSAKPPIPPAKVDDRQRRALDETAELLRSLGHDVVERDPDFGRVPIQAYFVPRYLRGAREDGERAEHPERLERRTRGLMRLGRLVPDSALARARTDGEAWARGVMRFWDDVDVLVMPTIPGLPGRLNEMEGLGTVRMVNASTPKVTFTAPWNITGQPAASVPAGWSQEGVPLAVQLIGRPNDEATLLSLAAQLERERPWADRLPPLAAD